METGSELNSRRSGRVFFVPRQTVIKILRSQRKDLASAPAMEDYRAHFYETYRKEAEDYDKEFIKKYDEDLNTTLIFVSLVCYSNAHVLTWVLGRSVLRRDFCLHHRGQLPAPT